MGERITDLSLWLTAPALGGPPPPHVDFAPAAPPRADAEPQYVLTQTALGDMALHWTAYWLRGLFCVTDLPREWVLAVRDAIRGPSYEGVWPDAGEDGSGTFFFVPARVGVRTSQSLPGMPLALPAAGDDGA